MTTTHLIPPRPDPIFTDAPASHPSKSSSSPTPSSTFTPPPPATTDTDPNDTIEFNTSDYTISSRRRRRRTPCLELADGARLATELVSKAMALLVCCVLLTVTMSKDRREAIDNQKRRSHTSNSSSTASSSSSSHSSTSASFDPSSYSHSAFTDSIPSTPKKSSHSPHPPSPSTSTSASASGDRSASPPYTPNSHPHANKPHVGQGSLDASSLPRRSKPTYYETLLVSTTATSSEIKAAHRRLAIRYHPDKSSSSGRTLHALTPAQSQAMFIQVQEAYEVLSNPTERRRYDYALAHRMRYRKLANGSSIIEPSDDATGCRPVTPSPSSSSSAGHGLGGFAGSFASFGSWYATSAATSRNTSRASTRTHSRRDSFDEAQWSHAPANGSATNSSSSASSSSSSSASSSSSSHSHRHRSIYLALPLALLSVFVLRPLRAFGIRARIRRAKSMIYSRIMYYLQPAFRVWSFIQRVRRWSMIQWITSTIAFGTFIALYIPVSCLCWINERKRRVRKIIFGQSNETEQSPGSTASRSVPQPKYTQSPPSHAHPSTFPSPTSSPNTYFFYPRPSAPYSSIPLSREVPADSTSSETSSPSMSTSSSASSMSSVDSAVPSPPYSSSHPSSASVPTLGASSNLTGRSLSESEYEASDEEWNTATLNGEKSQIDASSTTATTVARMKKSRSMPFALQLNDNKFTFE